ncbi:MAG: hypothetical protein JSV32_04040, partial [Dehalococcoidia bacterium]
KYKMNKLRLTCLILIGGALVIGSYVYGLLTYNGNINDLWGGASEAFKIVNVPFMILAAIGFLGFTYFILFKIDADEVKIANRFGYSIFYLIYSMILFPSAFWMPLTFVMISNPNDGLWIAIRLLLAVIGIASLVLLCILLNLRSKHTGMIYWMALLGAAAFSIQTFIFDTFLWPLFY